MSTDLICFQKINDPLSWVRTTGEIIAKSRMFGCSTIEQGQALSLISLTEQLPMLELRRRYHVVDGDLTMRADYMRAEFRRLGGEYRWVKDGEDGIEARMWVKFKGDEREVSYTIEHAKKEGLVKAGSRWVKAPGDMLRARCSTKAVRMVASEVLAGFATDEEMGGDPVETETTSHSNGNGSAASAAAASKPAGEVVDAEFTVVPDESAKASEDGFASSGQARMIYSLFDDLKLKPEQRAAILAKRNVESARSLTAEQAVELITGLQKKLADVAAAQSVDGGQSAEDPAAHSSTRNGPCSQVQIDKAKALLMEVEQSYPGLSDKLKEKLQATGRMPAPGCKLLSVLTYAEMDSLLQSLMKKEMEAFFAKSLQPVEKPAEQPVAEAAAGTEGEPKN